MTRYLQRFSSPGPSEQQAKLKLYVMPHAGASPAAYRPWLKRLPASIDACAIFLPGRWSRLTEPAFTRMEPLADAVSDAVRTDADRPFILVGHSLGALIAFEVMHRLEASGLSAEAVVFSSRRSPHLPLPQDLTRIAHLADRPLVEALDQRYGGIPKALLESDELLGLFAGTLRADMQVFESYRFVDRDLLRSPAHAWCGDKEHTMQAADLNAWQHVVASPLQTRTFTGGHFYFQEDEARFVAALAMLAQPIIG